jgi:hypothetical protein
MTSRTTSCFRYQTFPCFQKARRAATYITNVLFPIPTQSITCLVPAAYILLQRTGCHSPSNAAAVISVVRDGEGGGSFVIVMGIDKDTGTALGLLSLRPRDNAYLNKSTYTTNIHRVIVTTSISSQDPQTASLGHHPMSNSWSNYPCRAFCNTIIFAALPQQTHYIVPTVINFATTFYLCCSLSPCCHYLILLQIMRTPHRRHHHPHAFLYQTRQHASLLTRSPLLQQLVTFCSASLSQFCRHPALCHRFLGRPSLRTHFSRHHVASGTSTFTTDQPFHSPCSQETLDGRDAEVCMRHPDLRGRLLRWTQSGRRVFKAPERGLFAHVMVSAHPYRCSMFVEYVLLPSALPPWPPAAAASAAA